eukprot:scaffold1740_cov254-Pinguiococcus_pyrenoidosus.AAC.29
MESAASESPVAQKPAGSFEAEADEILRLLAEGEALGSEGTPKLPESDTRSGEGEPLRSPAASVSKLARIWESARQSGSGDRKALFESFEAAFHGDDEAKAEQGEGE